MNGPELNSAQPPARPFYDQSMKEPMSELIAHSANAQGREQPLMEHLENVARLAAAHAAAFQSEHFAEWLGWWHDAGKVAEDIQIYLRDTQAVPPGPDHSSAGMLKAAAVCTPFAYNIAGHHGGLPNQDYLKDRIKRKTEEPKEQRVRDSLALAERILSDHAPEPDFTKLPPFLKAPGPKESYRRTEFWLRMLHSALVDADCLDTEAHFNAEKHAERTRSRPTIPQLWEQFQQNRAALLGNVAPSRVNDIRARIYADCINAAALEPGIFSLTVPTGGGKTLSALGFALSHALRHSLRRVIIALPYTTIIEQNADVYRTFLGTDSVLEHHSSVRSREEPGKSDGENGAEQRQRMAAENWDAPLIVTTSVQLLESLFANRNSRVRKLHNLANSVLVLDEVQTLPPHLLAPTLEVLRHLSEAYGVTLLLCTATQPAFLIQDENIKGFDKVTEIISDPQTIYDQLKRVDYRLELETSWDWSRVAEELRSAEQAMVVLNTVGDALHVVEEMNDDPNLFHLSANLCGKHRREVLSAVRSRLAAGLPVRLVATQVVEAGVDIDFPLVLRALGPLDSIIQAAGRCNREGKRERGEVIVFRPAEGKMPPDAYKRGAEQAESMLRQASPESLHNYRLPTEYFRRLYGISDADRAGVQPLREQLKFAETAQAYRLIDQGQIPVLVRYKHDPERDRLIAAIEREKVVARWQWRLLQPHIVNLRERRLNEARELGICREIADGLFLLEESCYDAVKGVVIRAPGIGDLIVDD